MTDRVIVLIDMDCFYCQVETRLNPALKGIPMAVVQYNQWRGGGIIAVNYEARDRGVTRHMRGNEAKKHCPEIVLVTVPTVRDKADLTRYRDAGREVISVFCQFTNTVQRASVDEAYIDLTLLVDERLKSVKHFEASQWKSTFIVGYTIDGCNDEEKRQSGMRSWLEDCESIHNSSSLRLAVGALIVEEMRAAVLAETGFNCSAGIAHNKILAKLACGLHKPNRQTVLPQESVEELYKNLSVKKIRNLGGKFGDDVVEKLGCKTMSDLSKFSEKDLQNRYDEKTGTWLYNIARGYDYEAVTARLISKSIGCCKKFPGKTALTTAKDVHHWLNKLAEELSERLLEDEAMNKRRAQLLTVSMGLEINRIDTACSKSVSLTSYSIESIFNQAEVLLKKSCKLDPISGVWTPPIKFLGLSAGKFSDVSSNKIDKFFKVGAQPVTKNVKADISVNVDKHREQEGTEEEKSVSETTSRPSFFEKIFAKDIQNSGKKLHLVPDLTKNDLFSDSDESQSSLIKLKTKNLELEENSKTLRDSIKKNLFDSNSNETVPHCEKNVNPIAIADVDSSRKVSLNQKEDSTSKISESKPKKKNSESKKSIASFFDQSAKRVSWTKLDELFPDISQVDETLLSLLPLSYRNEIIKRKQEKNIKDFSTSKNTDDENYSEEQIKCPEESNHSNEQLNGNKNTTQNNDILDVQCKDLIDSCNQPSNNDRCNFAGNSNNSYENVRPDDSTCIDSTPSDYLVTCDECGEKVSNYEVHMDMHFAKKLHRELNSNVSIPPVIKKQTEIKQKEKRKKNSNSRTSVTNPKKLKSIDAFFKS